MRPASAILFVAVATLLSWAGPARAIRFGTADFDHDYVGLVLFYDDSGTPLHRCSGALISPDVLLTAAHCTFGTALAQVWFDQEISPESGYPRAGGVIGTPMTHPGFTGALTLPNTSDIGVVLLDEPVATEDGYAALPEIGLLDGLATRRGPQYPTFTVVGYGLQRVKPAIIDVIARLRADVGLINLTSALTDGFNLQHTNSPGQGHGPGGSCFGDSGGPVLLGDVVVAITSFGTATCGGVGFGYRVDIEESQAFLMQFLD